MISKNKDKEKDIQAIELLLSDKVCRDTLPKYIFNYFDIVYIQRSEVAKKYINCLTKENFDTRKFYRVGFSPPKEIGTIKEILARTKSLDEIARLRRFLVSSCIYTQGENKNNFIGDKATNDVKELQTALTNLEKLEGVTKSKTGKGTDKNDTQNTVHEAGLKELRSEESKASDWLRDNGYIDDEHVPERLSKYKNLRDNRDKKNYKDRFNKIVNKHVNEKIALYMDSKELNEIFKADGLHIIFYDFDVPKENVLRATFHGQNAFSEKIIKFLKLLNANRGEHVFGSPGREIFKAKLGFRSIETFEKFIRSYGTMDDFKNQTQVKVKIDMFCLLCWRNKTLGTLLNYFFSKKQLQSFRNKYKTFSNSVY